MKFPQTLRDLARYQAIHSRLADPRQPSGTGEGKVVVFVTCSIHADEVASTQTAVEFAWRLLAEDSVKFRIILDNVILVLVPSLNPDGVDIVTRWYRKTLGTPFEGTSPPELYQKYTGHDNNRDWYIFSQQETRLVVSQLHNVWHPQIVLDMHQQGQNGSRMFLPPWLDPIDPNVDPILVQRTNAFGSGMAADLTAAGKTGIVINALYDFWTPARHYQGHPSTFHPEGHPEGRRLSCPVCGTGRSCCPSRSSSRWRTARRRGVVPRCLALRPSGCLG